MDLHVCDESVEPTGIRWTQPDLSHDHSSCRSLKGYLSSALAIRGRGFE